MFENSGSKIKVLAKVVFWIETIGCIITALSMFGLAADSYDGAFFVGIGVSVLFAGPFAAWISALFVYAFGTLVENSEDSNDKLREIKNILNDINRKDLNNKKEPAHVKNVKEIQLAELKKMTDDGILSKEAYTETVKKIDAEYKDENLERPGKKLSLDLSGDEKITSTHYWRCSKCGRQINAEPCPYCGEK